MVNIHRTIPKRKDRHIKETILEREKIIFTSEQNRIIGKGHLIKVKQEKHKCNFCGLTYPLEEHHILPKSMGGSDKKENKMWLCRNHHTILHEKLSVVFNFDEYDVVYDCGKVRKLEKGTKEYDDFKSYFSTLTKF